MANRGYRPQRTCLGCGARDDQAKLIRVTAIDANSLKIDRTGTGRGGYLHGFESCWQAFVKRKSAYRAFHIEISKPAKENLLRELKKSTEAKGLE